jgi:hypothetical protein
MKKRHLILLSAAAAALCSTLNANILITGVFDGDGSNPKGIEVYVTSTGDYTGWEVEIQSNGGPSWSSGYVFDGSYNAGDFVYLTSTANTLTGWGWDTSKGVVISDGSFNQNGNDSFRIVDASANFVDTLGEDGIDGIGLAWEYTDSYAYRATGTGPDPSFTLSNWNFGGPNYLEGVDQQVALTNVFGTYTMAAVPEPSTIAAILGLCGLAFVMIRRRR